MHLSIAYPTSPLGQWVGEGWGFDQPKIQMTHCLGKLIPSHPLYLEAIKWGFDQIKGEILHPAGT